MDESRGAIVLTCVLATGLVSPGCIRPAQERAELDRQVGRADAASGAVEVVDGLAAIRRLDDDHLQLWAQAPAFDVRIEPHADTATRWTLTVDNAMPGAKLSVPAGKTSRFRVVSRAHPSPTTLRWTVDLDAADAVSIHVGPADAATDSAFRVAVLSDIQDDVSEVGDLYRRINTDPRVRFVVSAGDITQFGTMHELVFFQTKLAELNVPFYTTTGNHEIGPAGPEGFSRLYGRTNFQFRFKGVYFTFLDSASATVDPLAYDWLDQWLARAKDAPQVFITHIPPIDPSGIRNGSFRSRNEAAKLLGKLGRAGVDIGLYGHIHSYYAQSNATVPIYISGGGGALPERFDGIARHYLTVDYTPENGLSDVGVVRVGGE